MPINGDTSPADDRTMTVALTDATFATDTTDTVAVGSPTSGTGTIVDDDWRIAGLSSTPGNATVSEAGGATIDFTGHAQPTERSGHTTRSRSTTRSPTGAERPAP